MSRSGKNEALSHALQHRTYRFGSYRVELFKQGLRNYQKVSYPARCGIYHQIETPQAILHFNLNYEVIRLIGKQRDWPHPQEWLKRTIGNDWIYYSTGGYTGVYETTGEFYLPNLPYATNNHLGGKPLLNGAVSRQIESWYEQVLTLNSSRADLTEAVADAVGRVLSKNPAALAHKSKDLQRIIEGPVSVLPPDTRHVDYQVIPLTISVGCLYKCGFCQVKNSRGFKQKQICGIDEQINQIKDLMAADLNNFNSIFLGQHDALNCDSQLICHAVEQAHQKLHLSESYIQDSNTFLFGSVDSLLQAEQRLFDDLDKLPGQKYINIGLESADQSTLDMLEKPISAADVIASFEKIQLLNNHYPSIEITANFVTDSTLPAGHYSAMMDLIRDRVKRKKDKGCIYLSPLRFNDPSRARLFDFYRLKRLSRLPLFLYTIQRL